MIQMTRREFLKGGGAAVAAVALETLAGRVSAGGQSAPPPAPAADEAGCVGWGIPWEIAPSKRVRVFVPIVVSD